MFRAEERWPATARTGIPKTETLDRDQLEALQLVKLRRQCEWAAARSPWYRRRFADEGFDPRQLRRLTICGACRY